MKTPSKKRKPVKGRLIKGMSKKLPRVLLEATQFRNRLKEIMKGYSGIYGLYNKDELYYVGLTNKLFSRLNNHLKDQHYKHWTDFRIFRIKKLHYMKDIETILTNLFQLKGNKVKGKIPKLPQDEDINRMLRDLLKNDKKLIEGIQKALKRR